MKLEKSELFNKYILPETKFVYRLCFKYSKTKDECKEYFSEAMFRLVNSADTYNPQLHIRPWLYTITRRLINELQAKKEKLRTSDFINIEALQIHPIEEVEVVSSNCMGVNNYQQYYSDDILDALNTINPVSCKAILLQQAGYTLNEIVNELYSSKLIKNPNIDTVKGYLHRGKT